jgi:hypothetical protein
VMAFALPVRKKKPSTGGVLRGSLGGFQSSWRLSLEYYQVNHLGSFPDIGRDISRCATDMLRKLDIDAEREFRRLGD